MSGTQAPRPSVGGPVHLVMLRDVDTEVLSGLLRFDRGRGLVVDLEETPDSPLKRGQRVLMTYPDGEGLYVLRGSVAEVLSATRVYVLPGSLPVMMEKREYIRAVVPVDAALAVGIDAPGDTPLRETSVELSASGFRWFGTEAAAPGTKSWLCLRLPRDGRRACLAATIIRCDAAGASFELAGRFDTVEDDLRDALLDLVYRRRLADLGVEAGRTWDDDG